MNSTPTRTQPEHTPEIPAGLLVEQVLSSCACCKTMGSASVSESDSTP